MKEIRKKDLREFGMVLAGIIIVIGTVQFFKKHGDAYQWFWGVGGVTLFISLFVPIILKPLFIGFTKVAHVLGWVNTRVILILIYYFLVCPIGFVMKLFGMKPLDCKIDNKKETYWIKRVHSVASKESLEKQF